MSTNQKTILMAEDDPFMVTLLSDAFQKEGLRVVLAISGEDVIQKFKDEKPDLLLLDIVMPQKSGLEALREIRALEGGAAVPAIMLSNLEDEQSQAAANELNVAQYLVKAKTHLPEIVEKVKAALGA
ncbi:response regulator [Candidatus Parcubacteria bacterium]|nr:MAG: response regulator [Candidatus Parcubacteria bacterium]